MKKIILVALLMLLSACIHHSVSYYRNKYGSQEFDLMVQIAHCWAVPNTTANNSIVVIDVDYNPDGTYKNIALTNESNARYQTDAQYRILADSAISAIKLCSPLHNLPPEKYEIWREMELRFDPKFMLN